VSFSVIIHIVNEDPILCDVDRMPDPKDQVIIVSNPRRKDGKNLHYLEEDVNTVVIPWHRVNIVQVLPSAELEEVIGFVRE
jgi:hypothetical protein